MNNDPQYLELIRAVRKMREAQKNYFRHRAIGYLEDAKKLEAQVDKLIEPETATKQLNLL